MGLILIFEGRIEVFLRVVSNGLFYFE